MSNVTDYLPSAAEECVILLDALKLEPLDAVNRGWFYAAGGQIALAMLEYRGLLEKIGRVQYRLTERGRQVVMLEAVSLRAERFVRENPDFVVHVPLATSHLEGVFHDA